MKRNCILIALTFIFSSYLKKDIDITSFEYSRYVKPQLKSIVQDYKTLLIGLNEEMKPLSKSFDLKLTLYKKEFSLPKKCFSTQGKTCLPLLSSIKNDLDEINENIEIPLEIKNMKNITVDEIINAKNLKQKLKLQIIRSIDNLETVKLKLGFASADSVSTLSLKQNLQQTIDKLDLYFLALSDNRFRLDLQNYQSSFIKPVTKFILIRDQKEIFIQNINEFNIRLNAIVMRITKFNFPVDKKVKTLSNIIHKRWNNILKVSLITNPKK